MKRRTKIILGAVSALLVASLVPVRTVDGSEMAPSILPDDLVWVLPGLEVQRGDVVALADPLDPSRTILRRAIGPAGTQVHFTDDGIRVDAKRLRVKDMGRLDGYGVYQETIWSKPPAKAVDWLIRRRRDPPVKGDAEPIEIPQGHWYLLADDRDDALDSRWWGPVPDSAIKGVVRLRYGPAHLWRQDLEVMQGTQ